MLVIGRSFLSCVWENLFSRGIRLFIESKVISERVDNSPECPGAKPGNFSTGFSLTQK